MSPKAELMLGLSVLLLGVLLGGAVAWGLSAYRRWRASRAVRRAAARGYEGEQEAAELLRRAGYRVVDAQPSFNYEFLIDGVPHTAEMRPDYLVEADGMHWVVEVKTGRDRRPTSRNTRRQLLEYATYVEGVAGALLVDAEAGEVLALDFPTPTERPDRTRGCGCAIGGFVLGLLGAALLSMVGAMAGAVFGD